MIAEMLAMHPRPNQAAIGVDIHLAHTELGGRQIFIFVHATRGGIEFAADQR